MFARKPRHAGGYSMSHDVARALAGRSHGRHATGPADPVDVTLADLLEPVAPAGFPGFESPSWAKGPAPSWATKSPAAISRGAR